MEFSIGMQVSREFAFEETKITNVLNESLNKFFVEKDYGIKIKKIYSDFICVSKAFELVVPVRPLKILKNEAEIISFSKNFKIVEKVKTIKKLKNKAAIEYKKKIDFSKFKNSNEEKRTEILFSAFFNETLKLLSAKKIKDFDLEKFK